MVAAIDENKYDFIVVNYANGDMVGHTGVYSAIEKAVVAIDACVRDTVEAAKANGYEVIIIADHGKRQCRECRWNTQYGSLVESCAFRLCDGEQERTGRRWYFGRCSSLDLPHHGIASAGRNDRT